MDEIQQVRAELEKRRLCELDEVAKGSKVPLPTVVKIYYGTTKYPSWPTLKKLVAYFGREQRKAA